MLKGLIRWICRKYAARIMAQGDLQTAVKLWSTAIACGDTSPQTQKSLGELYFQLGDHARALPLLRSAAPHFATDTSLAALLAQARGQAADPGSAEAHYRLGNELQGLGRHDEAVASYQKALALNPDYAEAHNNLGIALIALNRPQEAIASYRNALAVKPNFASFHFNLAHALYKLGRHEEAIASYRQALALNPNGAETYYNLGNALSDLKRFHEAVECYQSAIKISPGIADAHYGLGNALVALDHHAEAIASYQQAIALKTDFAEAHNSLGSALIKLDRHQDALESCAKAVALKPALAEGHCNLGLALYSLRRHDEAVACYQHALELKPDFFEAYNNLGIALGTLTRYEDAIACHRQALLLKPDSIETHVSLANALLELARYSEAIASYQHALALNPNLAEARSSVIHACQHLCEWQRLSADIATLREREAQDAAGKILPFGLLLLPGTNLLEQFQGARRFAETQYRAFLSRSPLCGTALRADRPLLRIGYLSADFHNHPVMRLLAEVIERHNRSHFEVFGYSCGPDNDHAMRKRMQAAFDTFRDIAPLSHEVAARQILDDGIDILVDLTGYTANNRLPILALRPAPIQVSWLGYPGTLGHPRLADYLIGDATVTPIEHAAHYSETLALMPNCYQPNDRQRAIGEKPARLAAGLPADGFVFCCFNQSNRFNPAVFDLWCRLLTAVPGSVLWLLQSSAVAERNLRNEAQARGVAPERLVFAPMLPLAEHLGRLQLADLALDTYPYGSHTTASDALWAGVPLVTRQGETFASRVAASIVNAAGLPELIATNPEEYYRLALDLATQPGALAHVKSRLAANRMSCPLFDSTRFVRDLERLFRRMWNNYLAGTRRHIVIDADNDDAEQRTSAVTAPASTPAPHTPGDQLPFRSRTMPEFIIQRILSVPVRWICRRYASRFANQGDLHTAIRLWSMAIASGDTSPQTQRALGEIYFQLGDYPRALPLLESAAPHFATDTSLASLLAQVRGQAAEPGSAEAHYKLGNALQELKRHDEAVARYQRALALKPDYAEAHNNLGIALIDLNRPEEAIASYRKALEIRPDFAGFHFNCGFALNKLDRHEEAIASYRKALELKPDDADTYQNLGLILGDLKRHEEAIVCFERALALNPDLAEAHISWIFACQNLCVWRQLTRESEALRLRVTVAKSGKISPFSFLALPATELREQYLCAQQFAGAQYRAFLSRPPLCAGAMRAPGTRIRIGYLSADFHDHATSYLLAEVIEHHDRSHFEVFGYSYGPDSEHPMRRRMQVAFDVFRDISRSSHEEAAHRILDDGIDILVDLKGYTKFSRPPILALRPAPMQVSWLGYPGTLGHPRLADYLIGDATVTPIEHAAHYSEALALMPHCYQPNDRQRILGARPARTDVGLPADGFVFCSLNQAYKITPDVFDLWCRLLTAVPGSVLWLLQSSAAAERNLRNEAQARGVAPERLVFAPMLPLAEHLGRLQLADLALDTYPYGSHTTASDALWAGVPLVTRQGETFASRVAASIVNAAGLPELIATNPEEYYRLALDLATQPGALAHVKSRLAANRMSCPLFDSTRFVHDLERLFRRMWNNYLAGTRQHIVLAADEEDRSPDPDRPDGVPAAVPAHHAQNAQTPTLAQALKEAFENSQQNQSADAGQPTQLFVRVGGDNFDALYLLGALGARGGRVDEAIGIILEALRRNPGSAEAHTLLTVCAWPQLTRAVDAVREQITKGKSGEISPLGLLSLPATNASEQYLCARQYADRQYGEYLSRPPLCGSDLRADPTRLRIGFLSADYHEHPVSYLVVETIECLDRGRFEVFGYSYGPDSAGSMRARMRAAFDTFHDIRPLSHEAAAQLILDDRIDILVDLTGHTTDTRLEILALRPAPVQVSWLGYPGTLGHPRLADYLIGDAIVSPLEHAAHYSESLALMPNCFQPNDSKRVVGAAPHRTAAGLPAQGLVFCCFNQSYKITPAIFDLWCRLLAGVPGSVLWLLGESDAVQRNLRQEALQRGVTQDRLIFAPRVTYAEHLARFQLADLFLDTLPFNAGATGNDALWAGVPLVTCLGDPFAGRMASSLLNGVGLPELMTDSLQEYEALALSLATNGPRIAEYRTKLARSRDTCPLFDSERFVHDLGRLFHRMWENYRAGTRRHIVIAADDQL